MSEFRVHGYGIRNGERFVGGRCDRGLRHLEGRTGGGLRGAERQVVRGFRGSPVRERGASDGGDRVSFGPPVDLIFQEVGAKGNYLDRVRLNRGAPECVLDQMIGEKVRRIAKRRAGCGGGCGMICRVACQPKWTPDGRFLYVTLDYRPSSYPTLVFANARGQDPHRAWGPTLSRDLSFREICSGSLGTKGLVPILRAGLLVYSSGAASIAPRLRGRLRRCGRTSAAWFPILPDAERYGVSSGLASRRSSCR